MLAPLAVEPTLCTQLLQLCGYIRNVDLLPDTQQIVLCVLSSIQMRPINWMRQKMKVPPAMDKRQHRHKSALEHNNSVDTKITKLAKGRNIKTQVLIPVGLLIPKIKEVDLINMLDVMGSKQITTPPPSQHRTQRNERALQQLESCC